MAVQFQTPESISRLMVGLLNPTSGSIYDRCCGTGKLVIDASKYISNNGNDPTEIEYFAQEKILMLGKLRKFQFPITCIGG